MITEDNNTGPGADAGDLVGRIVICESGNTAYVAFVRQVLTVTVGGPAGDHPSCQVTGLLPEGLTLHFLLSDVDRVASPQDLARLSVAERLSERLPEAVLAAFHDAMQGSEGGHVG